MPTLVDNKGGPEGAPRAGAADSRAARHPEKQNRPDTPLQRKPSWIRVKAPTSEGYLETKRIVREGRLTTVCEEAGCPNIGECWTKKHATLMIMGDTCTRACSFCNVKTGMPRAVDLAQWGNRSLALSARPGACPAGPGSGGSGAR